MKKFLLFLGLFLIMTTQVFAEATVIPADPGCDPAIDPGCEEICEPTDPACCDPMDPVCPNYECEPTDPACCDPADPVCPNYECEPTDPACCDPADPVCPNYECEPTDPACCDPMDPVCPNYEDPTDPIDPTDPVDPVEPGTTADPTSSIENKTGWEADSTSIQTFEDECGSCIDDLSRYNTLIDIVNDPLVSLNDRDLNLNELYELRSEIQTCLDSLPDSCEVYTEMQIDHTPKNQSDFTPYAEDDVPVYITGEIFPDVQPEELYAKAVYFLTELGVINGYPDGSYKPDQAVNRVEALKILFAAISLNRPDYYVDSDATSYDLGFPDTYVDQWYVPYVFVAKASGIVQGYPDGTFKPGDNVNKVEFLKMAFEAFGISVNQISLDDAPYSDVTAGEWYMPYINLAYHLNLFDVESGEAINPGQDMTRQEVAQVTHRLLKSADSTYMNHDVIAEPSGETFGYPGGVFVGTDSYSKACKPIGETQNITKTHEEEFIKKITIYYKDGSTSNVDGNKEIEDDIKGKIKLGAAFSSTIVEEINGQVEKDNKSKSDIDKVVLLIEVTKTTTNRTIECVADGDSSKWKTNSENKESSTKEIEKTVFYSEITGTDDSTIEDKIFKIKDEVAADPTVSKKRNPKSECNPAGATESKEKDPKTYVYIDEVEIYVKSSIGGDSYVKLESNDRVWNHGKGEPMNTSRLSNASSTQLAKHIEWYIDQIYPKNKTIDDITKIVVKYLVIKEYYKTEKVCVQKSIVQDGETLTWNEWSSTESLSRSERSNYQIEWTPFDNETAEDIADSIASGKKEGYNK